jgi:hypothetical protein
MMTAMPSMLLNTSPETQTKPPADTVTLHIHRSCYVAGNPGSPSPFYSPCALCALPHLGSCVFMQMADLVSSQLCRHLFVLALWCTGLIRAGAGPLSSRR